MSSELTEEEMRRALFGTPQPEEQISAPLVNEPVEEIVLAKNALSLQQPRRSWRKHLRPVCGSRYVLETSLRGK